MPHYGVEESGEAKIEGSTAPERHDGRSQNNPPTIENAPLGARCSRSYFQGSPIKDPLALGTSGLLLMQSQRGKWFSLIIKEGARRVKEGRLVKGVGLG